MRVIRPLKDRLVLKPISPPKMVGSLYIPENQSSKNQTFYYAEVLAAGPKCLLAKVGDKVVISEYAGDPMEIDGEKVLMMSERDLAGVCQ